VFERKRERVRGIETEGEKVEAGAEGRKHINRLREREGMRKNK